MKKTLITSVVALTIALSAGMSMAGPLRDHSQRSFTGEALKTAAKRNSKYKKADMYYEAFTSSTSSGANWSSELPYVVVIPVEDNGNYTWIFGKTTGSDLSDQLIWMNYR
ncbi:hypothetical protein [Roseibium sp. RKSG952]|uniref:hypothetical protein n=1 Tax=Roseibium sp. RKSG952 TaxID=2529384 RepID=UPI0012BBC0F4|nr:hypothetical protein [Roseibium sp. RKSG952]MTI03285.1 hypothetical protein [Roseibium sp. RKSG952]